MITTDDIMALAAAMLRAGPNYDGTISELRAAVAALVAERDLAAHEQDVAQESLRQHEVWLQEAQAERDALRVDADKWKAINMLSTCPAKRWKKCFTCEQPNSQPGARHDRPDRPQKSRTGGA